MKTAIQCVGTAPATSVHRPIEINVVLDGLENAAGVLELATGLARGIHAKLAVHFAQVVPYPLPLKSPPVPVEIAEKNLLDLASKQPVETSANIYLCRDRSETIRHALKPESIVIFALPHRWWRSFERTLAKQLIRDGHRVITLPAQKKH